VTSPRLFGIARLIGTPESGIALATSASRAIENAQAVAPDERARALYQASRKGKIGWTNRRDACGVYNCFGLVWASRRTSIYEVSEIEKILSDDAYRRIDEATACIGDIVIYRHQTLGPLHAGLVVEARLVGSAVIPYILSKWSDSYGEDIHSYLDVPQQYLGCGIEFWTDRP